MMKRHAIQVLRRAGHTLDEIAAFVAVSKSSVQRVVAEPGVTHDDTELARHQRQVGRPSKAEPLRALVTAWLEAEPELRSVEILRRAKLVGYTGEKSALYELARSVRRPLAACWSGSRACQGSSHSMTSVNGLGALP